MFVRNIAGSSNGRTAAFGAAYLGSNPSPAAFFLASKNYIKPYNGRAGFEFLA